MNENIMNEQLYSLRLVGQRTPDKRNKALSYQCKADTSCQGIY